VLPGRDADPSSPTRRKVLCGL